MSDFPTDAVSRRRLLQAGLLAVAAPSVLAQGDYPSRPITIVVPFPAGGPTDASARIFAKVMGPLLGQPIVVDNRAGAAGTVGSAFVARAPADGYTLLWGGTSTLAVAPGLYKNLKYDAQSFVPVGMALRGPQMLVASPRTGITSLADLVQKAKTQQFTIGTAGEGSIGHLAMALLCEQAGIKLTHVPYRGGGPALSDVLGGQIDLDLDNGSLLYPHVKAGKLRALAVTGAQPYAPTPDVPTVRSVLNTDYEAYSWFGLVAPKGTPDAVLQKLRTVFAQSAQNEEIRKQLSDTGQEPGVPDPAGFGDVIAADHRKWSGVITRADVHVE
jgi:tripartite-type tricarboxylate transporter receptor subunit TctC